MVVGARTIVRACKAAVWQVGAGNGRGKCGAPRGGRAHHLLLFLLLRCHLRRRLLLLFHLGRKVLLAVLLRKHHGEGKEKRNQREEPNPAEHGNAVCVRSGVRACARSGPPGCQSLTLPEIRVPTKFLKKTSKMLLRKHHLFDLPARAFQCSARKRTSKSHH